jgi:hypothetical protein
LLKAAQFGNIFYNCIHDSAVLFTGFFEIFPGISFHGTITINRNNQENQGANNEKRYSGEF